MAQLTSAFSSILHQKNPCVTLRKNTAYPETINIRRKFYLPFWDALLAATMKKHNINTIYTEDSHFNKIPWLTVIDPFTG